MDIIENLNSVEDLKTLLINNNIAINTWGKIRTLDNLFVEIKNKESYLTLNAKSITRHVEAVSLEIRSADKVLLQYKQLYPSGEQNLTIKYPTEKMYLNEKPESACLRLLAEELNMSGKFTFTCISDKKTTNPAYAYPGLTNEINMHFFRTTLPANIKVQETYEEVTPKQTTYFKWFDGSFVSNLTT